MKNRRLTQRSLVVGLLVAGCSSGEPTDPPPDATSDTRGASPAVEARGGVALGNVTRTFGPVSSSDSALQPLGAVAAGDPIRLRLLPGKARTALRETWRIWLDLDGDRRFEDDELVRELTATGAQELALTLDARQQAALHGVEARTVAVRVATGDDTTLDVSVVAEGRPLAVRPVRLASGTISVEAASLDVAPGRHHLVQFRRLPTSEEKQSLAARGISLLGYVPERSFWARVSASAGEVAGIETAGGLVLAKPAPGAMKISAELAQAAKNGSETVAVHFFADATPLELAAAKAVLGAAGQAAPAAHVILTLPRERIAQLAELEAVQWIEPTRTTPTTHSATGNTDHNVTPLHGLPYELQGDGEKVAIFDAGWVDRDHPDLAERVFYDPTLKGKRGHGAPIGDFTAKHYHATRMAGIIASSGKGDARAIGTAPHATLYSYREAYSYNDPNDVVATESALHGWRVINHSYGNGLPCNQPSVDPCKSSPLWTSYIEDARNADTWAYDNGVLSVYSAGNDGLMKKGTATAGWETDNWSTIYSGAAAKNVIATCGATPLTRAGEKYQVRPDTSKGPASDGRVKPDVCAESLPVTESGQVWTTDIGGGYIRTQATSPAAAQVTGIVTLLQQAYHQLHGAEEHLPPALAKGLLIHSAVDVVEANSYRLNFTNNVFDTKTTPGPDYTSGWGWTDARAAVDTLQSLSSIRSGSVQDGLVQEFETSVPASSALKVTLIWTDPPATAGAERALVNDLDLRITNVSTGEESYPWILDKAFPMEPAQRGINNVDNVEQIVLQNDATIPQSYRISVRGSTVPLGPQPFFVLSSFPLAVVMYGTQNTYNGDLGGRAGADAKCLAEKPVVCGRAANVHAVISISTEDEMRDMQSNYGIPMATPVIGSKGLPLKDSWESLWGSDIANPLEVATNLPAGSSYWSGSGANGATATYATPGSEYLCGNFTSGTSDFRAAHGASDLSTPAEEFALGWDGGNVYWHCSRQQQLMCACW